MRPSLLLAALALLPAHALAQPAALLSRSAIPAPSGLVLVPGDSITVMHNGTSTTTLLPSLGAFLGAAPPLASNLVPGLMRGDGSTLTVDPLTGIASVVGTAATPLTGPVLGTDTFLIVRGSGTSAVPYSVTVPQLTAALGGLADGTTLSWDATTHQLSVVGQAPTAASTVPSLSNLNVLLADGTYLTGAQLQALLGITTQTTPTPTPAATPTATTISFAGAAGTQPTGTAALTPVGSTPPTGMALDGNGNLLLSTQTFANVLLEGLGIHGDGTIEIDAAPGGPQPLDILVILHSSADNSTSSVLAFQGEYEHVGAYLLGVSGVTTLPAPATFSKIRVTAAGGVITIVVDGTVLGTVTESTSTATGYLGIGSSSKTSPQVAIGGVSFQ